MIGQEIKSNLSTNEAEVKAVSDAEEDASNPSKRNVVHEVEHLAAAKNKLLTDAPYSDVEKTIQTAVRISAHTFRGTSLEEAAREVAEYGVLDALTRLRPDFNTAQQKRYISKAGYHRAVDLYRKEQRLRKQGVQQNLFSQLQLDLMRVSQVPVRQRGKRLYRGFRMFEDTCDKIDRVAGILSGATLKGERVSRTATMEYLIELGLKSFFGESEEGKAA